MQDEKKQQSVAIFRYGLIAPAIHMSRTEANRHFSELSKKEYDVPCMGRKKYSVKTLKNWLRQYRNGGIDNLKPAIRTDKGSARKISEDLTLLIKQALKDFPQLSASGIYRMFVKKGHISSSDLSENTLRKYIKDNNLREPDGEKTPRKKYEKENVNELWISDFMYGPYVKDGRKKKRRTYLCVIIDDHSRMIVGWEWSFNGNSIALANALEDAVSTYGVPQVLYCDNGKVFRTEYLQMIAAKLGTALVHSKPYDSSSRGKVERVIRTIRQKFLAWAEPFKLNLDQLITYFGQWLDSDYHNQFHSGINTSPKERYLDNIQKTKIKTLSKHEIDNIFLNIMTRTVKNDATISINNQLYEVPPEYIGKKVQISFPLDKPAGISLMNSDKPVIRLKKVNLTENANKPYTAIHFKNIDQDKGENPDD